MIRRVVLGAAFVAFAAPALAEEPAVEATATPQPATQAAAPVEAAATPSTTAEAAPATKVRYGSGKSGGCFFSASAPMS